VKDIGRCRKNDISIQAGDENLAHDVSATNPIFDVFRSAVFYGFVADLMFLGKLSSKSLIT
jgi:hypothetical protein